MKKREVRAQRERILKALERWQPILLPGDWKLRSVFDEEPHPNDEERDIITQAISFPAWEYQTTTVRWFLPAIVDESDEEVAEMVVHELIHSLLDPMSIAQVPVKDIERAVTALSRAFMRTVA